MPILFLSAVVPAALMTDPMHYFDGEYAWYIENRDFSLPGTDYYRVLILGDSQAKADWVPDFLSEDSYNYSLGGASPIEEYYYLREYLQNNAVPEYVIFTQGIPHFSTVDTLWTRSVYFHRLSLDQAADILSVKKMVNDADNILGDKDYKDVMLYYLYSPIYYSSAFFKGIFLDRQEANLSMYNEAVSARGHILFGDGNTGGCIKPADIVNESSFEVNALIDVYFRKIIQLCEDYGVKFVYQSAPVSEITYDNLDATVIAQYNGYMMGLRSEYPNAVINAELLTYSNDSFSDSVHLNADGAERFSRQMREKYDYIFNEEPVI